MYFMAVKPNIPPPRQPPTKNMNYIKFTTCLNPLDHVMREKKQIHRLKGNTRGVQEHFSVVHSDGRRKFTPVDFSDNRTSPRYHKPKAGPINRCNERTPPYSSLG